MNDVQEVVADPVVETVEATQVAPPETPAEPEGSTAVPAIEGDGQTEGKGEVVQATAEDARTNNYVPYTRFREVNSKKRELADENKQLRQERDQWLAQRQSIDQYRDERSRPPVQEDDPWADADEDPVAAARAAAREEIEGFRAEQQSQADVARQATGIYGRVDEQVSTLGFDNPDYAKKMIDRIVLADVKNGDMNPDVEAIARELRQHEVDTRRRYDTGYVEAKNSAAAKAAQSVPPSPPHVPAPPERELKGMGSRGATKRVMDRLLGR